jgi:hypothetical protein
VSELGDLLELRYRADSSWRTLRLSAQECSHVERTQRAFERYYAAQKPEGGGHVMSLYGSDAQTAPHETTTEIRVWAAADVERDGTHLRVFSDSLPAGDLADLAATLVPASTEPPPLLAE